MRGPAGPRAPFPSRRTSRYAAGFAEPCRSLRISLEDAIALGQERCLRSRHDMRLTKSTGHAIRILIDCAGAQQRLIKVAELSARLKITQQNVFKIVNL